MALFRFSGFFHSADNAPHEHWYVDLGEEHVVKTIVMAGRYDCCGHRVHDVKIWTGNSQPTSRPLNDSNFVLCGIMPYKMPYTHSYNGVMCYKWTVGRYVVVENNKPGLDNALMIVEVAVFGEGLAEFL